MGVKIGGYNINSLSAQVKYGVGFGFMGLCALVIYWFWRQLESIPKGRNSSKKSR